VDSVQRCVFCRQKPVAHAWRPFCSERCRLLDLAQWADGAYRVPGDPVDPPDGEEDGGNDRIDGGR
jgi:hypothetical protein